MSVDPIELFEEFKKCFPYPSFREDQYRILWEIAYHTAAGHRVIGIDAATGIGKTGVAIAVGRTRPTFIATNNKMLQDQYHDEFGILELDTFKEAAKASDSPMSDEEGFLSSYLPTLLARERDEVRRSFIFKGRSNYKCLSDENKNCQNSKKCKAVCHYTFCRGLANTLDLVVLNYHSLVMAKDLNKKEVLICDEAHNLPNVLTDIFALEISDEVIVDMGVSVKIPTFGFNYCKPPARGDTGYFDKQREVVRYYLRFANNLDFPSSPTKDQAESIKAFSDRVKFVSSNIDNYICCVEYTKEGHKIHLKPLRLDTICKGIFSGYKSVVLMSATLRDQDTLTNILGIDRGDYVAITAKTPFKKENRPIDMSFNVGSINKDTLESKMPAIINSIRAILDKHPNEKGMIHCYSYNIGHQINLALKDTGRVLYPMSAHQQKKYITDHIKSSKPTVLMSPSLTEGIDLKDDLARFQIPVRVPWPYLGDPVTVARSHIYPNYINMLTALTLEQLYGRAVRNDNDRAVMYPLDGGMYDFCNRNYGLLSPSFLEAIV